jgi:hypothetical protein
VTGVALTLPDGVLVWQTRCDDCGGAFGVLTTRIPDDVHPIYCPFCARRIGYRLAQHKDHEGLTDRLMDGTQAR